MEQVIEKIMHPCPNIILVRSLNDLALPVSYLELCLDKDA